MAIKAMSIHAMGIYTMVIHAMGIQAMGIHAMSIHAIGNQVKDIHDIPSIRWSRVIVVCWGFAFLPAIPLMFNSTIKVSWENHTNCKCFYPLDDVSISSIFFQTNFSVVHLRN